MERRDFLKTAATATAAASITPALAQQQRPTATGPVTSKLAQHPDMQYRALGRTGEVVSLVGVGGFHLAKPGGMDNAEAINVVHAAIDAGITFFDNCWDYNDGESEVRLGRALANGYRDRVFLMTKLDGRTAKAAAGQLEESLARLKTDHIDLIQFHENIRPDDADRIFAHGGAIEAVLKAREQGKVRYIGFTGHKSPLIHQHMFEVADQYNFHFDTVQMPLNVMDAHYNSFEKIIVPIAVQHGTAILGMKAFGDDFIYKTNLVPPIEILQYPMNLPISVQITGIDSMGILQQALTAVKTFQPWSSEKLADVLGKTQQVAMTGTTERYKTTHFFDGTIHNPQWLTEA